MGAWRDGLGQNLEGYVCVGTILFKQVDIIAVETGRIDWLIHADGGSTWVRSPKRNLRDGSGLGGFGIEFELVSCVCEVDKYHLLTFSGNKWGWCIGETGHDVFPRTDGCGLSTVYQEWQRWIADDHLLRWTAALEDMALALRVEPQRGDVGLVHAGPVSRNRVETLAGIEREDLGVISTALFGVYEGAGPIEIPCRN